MALGTLLHSTLKIGRSVKKDKNIPAITKQKRVLKKLLSKAEKTAFGKKYKFEKILKATNTFTSYKENVPTYTYNKIYDEWWKLSLEDKEDICWPGRVKYYALSSGTSESSSKYIPVSNDMIRSVRKVGTMQIFALADFEMPKDFYKSGVLMLGGSTSLTKVGKHYQGDLSGILASRLPFWFSRFYKPGKGLAMEVDWNTKLEKIAKEAINWNIGTICGVPAWVQLLIEKIIEYHKVESIHDIWPNFSLFLHGGVSFTPYKNTFKKLLGKKVHYLDTYLASEGYFAYQYDLENNSMRLIMDNGVFFEFVPFNEKNFTAEGNMIDSPETFFIDQVKENEEYALLISTNSGIWRYLIGDTIRFTSVERAEILITGRTKHFLSLCGEHLSVDNMNHAIDAVSKKFNLHLNEYTVVGIPYENTFAHKWFIACDENNVDIQAIRSYLDDTLCEINDDYKTERKSALKAVIVEIYPHQVFMDWMESRGKLGGQNKFPRVLNKKQYEEWSTFLMNLHG